MGVTRCLSHPRTQIHLDLKMNCVVSQSILGSCRSYWVLETVLSKMKPNDFELDSAQANAYLNLIPFEIGEKFLFTNISLWHH